MRVCVVCEVCMYSLCVCVLCVCVCWCLYRILLTHVITTGMFLGRLVVCECITRVHVMLVSAVRVRVVRVYVVCVSAVLVCVVRV